METRLARVMAGFLFLSLLCTGLFTQEEDPVVVQERVKGKVEKLEKMMTDVTKTLRDCGKKEIADTVETALKCLRDEQTIDKVTSIIQDLNAKAFGHAQDKAQDVIGVLNAVLEILNAIDRKIQDQKKEDIERVIQDIDKLEKQEHEIWKQVRDAQYGDIGNIIDKLGELQWEQKRLYDQTAPSISDEIRREAEGIVREIEKLEEEQQGLINQARGLESKELAELADVFHRLNELIEVQKRLIGEVEKYEIRNTSLDEILKALDEVIKAQNERLKESEVALVAKGNVRHDDIAKRQDSVVKQLHEVGEKLNRLAREGVLDLETHILPVTKELEDGGKKMVYAIGDILSITHDYDIAEKNQKQAIRFLEGARKKLVEVKEGIAKNKKDNLTGLVIRQSDCEIRTGGLGNDTKKFSESASSKITDAGEDMKNAVGNLEKDATQVAREDQKKAVENLLLALEELRKLMKPLEEKEGQKFAGLVGKQEDLRQKAQKIGEKLTSLASKIDRSQVGKDAVQNAEKSMQHATTEMAQAGRNFGQAQPGQGQQSQAKSRQHLQEARKALDKMKDIKDERPVDEKDLANKQEKLKEEARKLAQKIEDKSNELGKEESEDSKRRSNAMKEAAQSTKQAEEEMKQAQQNLSKGGKGGRSQAGQNQQQAIRNLKDAKSKLEEEAGKKDFTKKQKEDMERLKKQQEDVREATKEVENKVPHLGVEGAKQDLEQAQKSQQKTEENLKQGYPNQEDPARAEGKLGDAKDKFKKKKKELEEHEYGEVLEVLRARLMIILEQQKRINAKTKELDAIKKAKGGFERTEVIELNKLADLQLELVGDKNNNLEWVHKRLIEEDEEVFAYVVFKVIEDMKSVSDFLKECNTGNFTQGIQADIVKRLEFLLGAFRRTKDEIVKRVPPGHVTPGPPQKPPFVPPKSKIRLLRAIQKELKERTENFEKTFGHNTEDLSPAEKQFSKKLTDEQGDLAQLTENFKQTVESKAGQRRGPTPDEPEDEDNNEDDEE